MDDRVAGRFVVRRRWRHRGPSTHGSDMHAFVARDLRLDLRAVERVRDLVDLFVPGGRRLRR